MAATSSIAAQKGRNLLLKLGNGASPEVYTTIAGFRTNEVTINGNPVDITNKASAGWQELLPGAGVRSVDITGSGIFDANSSGGMATLQNAALAGGSLEPMELVTDSGDKFTGYWAVVTLKRTGNHDNAETFDITLKSHGVIVFTPAP